MMEKTYGWFFLASRSPLFFLLRMVQMWGTFHSKITYILPKSCYFPLPLIFYCYHFNPVVLKFQHALEYHGGIVKTQITVLHHQNFWFQQFWDEAQEYACLNNPSWYWCCSLGTLWEHCLNPLFLNHCNSYIVFLPPSIFFACLLHTEENNVHKTESGVRLSLVWIFSYYVIWDKLLYISQPQFYLKFWTIIENIS